MMFDFYGIIGFKEKVDLSRLKNPFLKYELYNGLSFREEVIQTARAKFFRLEREGSYKSHFYKDQEHLFLFGFVFSSKEYESLTGKKPKRLSIKEVFELYKEYGGSIVRYVKGSFVLIMYNERVNKVLCISDQLNVLPIFYAYKKGLFIFSSAIKPILDSGFVDTDIDKMAIVEFAIFDYSLRDKTYYRDIKRLDYGMVLEADKKGLKKDRYFTVDRLFSERLMGDKESLEELGNLLHENVNLYASDAKRFSLSLTGGFDGRANLALLDRPAEDFLCFSYGMPGSRQINIPLEISKRLNLNYRPIYLDEKFEEQYEDNAIRAVFYSDGTAPILSANYPYSYEELQKFSDTVITGLFGSEILRPIHNLGIQFNDNSERLFMGRDFDKDLKYIFESERKRLYFQPIIFDECYDEIRDYVWENYFNPYRGIDRLTRFFFFFIGEGIRKYFMQEIRIERIYVSTRFPYFDFDLVNLMYRTPFAGMYNGALNKSAIKRRRAQLLYANVIDRYKPQLGSVITDRGYTPKALLSRLSYLKILPGYMRTQIYNKKIENDTFDSEHWTDRVFSHKIELMKKKTDIFPGGLYEHYKKNHNIEDNYYFSRVFSLKYWLEQLQHEN